MSNLSCGTHVAEPSANKDCRKLLNQFCRFLPKLKLPISADAKLPLTRLANVFAKLYYQQALCFSNNRPLRRLRSIRGRGRWLGIFLLRFLRSRSYDSRG